MECVEIIYYYLVQFSAWVVMGVKCCIKLHRQIY